MISSASICSVIRIVPISEAMFDPTLPARISATTVELNSSSIDSRAAYPIRYFGMKGDSRFRAIWIVMTAPINTEMIATMPIEFSPRLSVSARMRLP